VGPRAGRMLYAACVLRLAVVAVVATTAAGFGVTPATGGGGVTPAAHHARSALRLMEVSSVTGAEDCGCGSGVSMNDVQVSAATLRGMDLANMDGERVQSGSLLGSADGRSVVVFLRHLG